MGLCHYALALALFFKMASTSDLIGSTHVVSSMPPPPSSWSGRLFSLFNVAWVKSNNGHASSTSLSNNDATESTGYTSSTDDFTTSTTQNISDFTSSTTHNIESFFGTTTESSDDGTTLSPHINVDLTGSSTPNTSADIGSTTSHSIDDVAGSTSLNIDGITSFSPRIPSDNIEPTTLNMDDVTGSTSHNTDFTSPNIGNTFQNTGSKTQNTDSTSTNLGNTSQNTDSRSHHTVSTSENIASTSHNAGFTSDNTGSTSLITGSTSHITSSTYHNTDSTSHITSSTSHITSSTSHNTGSTSHNPGSTSHNTGSTSHNSGSKSHNIGSTSHITSSTSHNTGSTSHNTNPTSHNTDPTSHNIDPTSHNTGSTSHNTSDVPGQSPQSRSGKLFSLFNVVTWKQAECSASDGSGMAGTCMTSAQCATLGTGAVSSGSCAAGFGVCCVVTLSTCGSTVTQNCTYVTNPGYGSIASYDEAGTCQYNIRKKDRDICMVRLDFVQFTISAANIVPPAPVFGSCLVDWFTPVGVPGTLAPPTICGDITGQHMYLNAVQGSNSDLGFAITINNDKWTNNLPRVWKIKVSQYPCGALYTPPSTCTQYFTGMAGQVKSFNFGESNTPPLGVSHRLNNQNYAVCVRQEEGNCAISWNTCPQYANSFSVMGQPQGNARTGKGCTQNYVEIPDGHNFDRQCKLPGGLPVPSVNRFCGVHLNCIDMADSDQPIYSSVQPFGFHVYSNAQENNFLTNNVKGFCLNYRQIPC